MRMQFIAILALLAACSPSFAAKNANNLSVGRTTAMRDCESRAQKYTEYTWGNMEFQQYRACMAERGQME